MATRKKKPIEVEETPVVVESDEPVEIVERPTAPGETGNAPLTRPPQRDDTKWRQ